MPEKTEKNREIPDRDPEKICGEFYHLRADRMGTRDPAHIRGESCGDWKMMGRTSLYMFPIYGLGVLLGPIGRGVDAWIGDFGEISVRDWIIRHGILDMVLIFLTEYLTGSLLRRFGICPWDYTGRMLQINGVIRLDFAPFWFGTGLLFEYLTGRKTKSPLP